MTDNELRIKVAKLCGWKHIRTTDQMILAGYLLGVSDHVELPLPNYPHDLNACHEMEKVIAETLGQTGSIEYLRHLYNLAGSTCVWTDWQDRRNGCEFEWEWVCATARQRCEAFVKVMAGAK